MTEQQQSTQIVDALVKEFSMKREEIENVPTKFLQEMLAAKRAATAAEKKVKAEKKREEIELTPNARALNKVLEQVIENESTVCKIVQAVISRPSATAKSICEELGINSAYSVEVNTTKRCILALYNAGQLDKFNYVNNIVEMALSETRTKK